MSVGVISPLQTLRIKTVLLEKMGHGIHIQVTIPTDQPASLQELATNLLKDPLLPWVDQLIEDRFDPDNFTGVNEAYEFLSDLAEGKSFWKWGNQGSILIWGLVAKSGLRPEEPEEFVDRLSPLWPLLYDTKQKPIIDDWKKVIIVYSFDCGAPQSGLFEVGFDDELSSDRKIAAIHHSNLPFRCI